VGIGVGRGLISPCRSENQSGTLPGEHAVREPKWTTCLVHPLASVLPSSSSTIACHTRMCHIRVYQEVFVFGHRTHLLWELITGIGLNGRVNRTHLEIGHHIRVVVLIVVQGHRRSEHPHRDHGTPSPMIISPAVGVQRILNSLAGQNSPGPPRMIIPTRLGDVDELLLVTVAVHNLAQELDTAAIPASYISRK